MAEKRKAFFYIIAAGVFWGTSGIFVELLSVYGFSSLQMTAMRGIVSAVVMSVFLFFKDRRLFRTGVKELIMFFFSGAAVYATAACYFSAIKASSVSTAVVLMYTAPVMVMAFSVAFMGERFTWLKGVSVAAMTAGCALVSGIVGGMRFSPSGIVLGLMSGVAYSAYNILTKYQMKRNIEPLTAATYSFIFMGAISLFTARPAELARTVSAHPHTLILILLLGVVTCVLPYLLYTLSLRHIPVGTAAAMSVIEPMSATLFSVIFFEERLTVYSAAGILLILAAVLCLSRE